MGRRGGETGGASVRVFVRPAVMLALGLVAGIMMWRVLMRGSFEAAPGPPNRAAEAVATHPAAR